MAGALRRVTWACASSRANSMVCLRANKFTPRPKSHIGHAVCLYVTFLNAGARLRALTSAAAQIHLPLPRSRDPLPCLGCTVKGRLSTCSFLPHAPSKCSHPHNQSTHPIIVRPTHPDPIRSDPIPSDRLDSIPIPSHLFKSLPISTSLATSTHPSTAPLHHTPTPAELCELLHAVN